MATKECLLFGEFFVYHSDDFSQLNNVVLTTISNDIFF